MHILPLLFHAVVALLLMSTDCAAVTISRHGKYASLRMKINEPASIKNWHSEKILNSVKLGSIALIGLAVPRLVNAGSGPYVPPEFPVRGADSIMSKKSHGTSDKPVQQALRWNCDVSLADRISNYNRDWAEFAGYWTTTTFLKEMDQKTEITFYDSVTGVPLFVAPKGRSFDEWKQESLFHGWPSFRDNEVVWENVRALRNGETVSLTGTHLGHNLPDRVGNRYCINLVCIAGFPANGDSV